MAYPDFLFDKRVVQRNIEKGLVDRKDYAKFLSALGDSADNAEACLPDQPVTPVEEEEAPETE